MATEFTVSNMVHLREVPGGDVPSPRGIVDHGDVVTILSKQGEWSEVQVVDQSGNVRKGFVPTDMIEELPPPTPKEEAINEVNFALALTYVARTYGVNRDYLIAVAWAESRIKNVVNQATGAVGPFQFTPSTWAGLVASHLQQEGITERDIVDTGNQAVFAAIYTAEAQEQLLRKLERLPSGAELYIAHRLGLPAALRVLSTDRAVPSDQALLPAFQGQENAEGAVRSLVETHKDLFKEGDSIRTVEQALASATTRLNEGLREAARIVARLPEDEQFAPRLEGEAGAPWMTVAQQELRRGVIEDRGTGQSNPRIEEYHATTGRKQSDDVAWCAAFVSFCMEKSGNALVISQNLRSARAADWLKWGVGITEPTWGAVCVLRPLVPKSSGHVGFLTASDATTVTLLGGNQRDSHGNESVNEQRFSKADVRSYRWPELPLVGTDARPGEPPLSPPMPSPGGTARPAVQNRVTAIDTLARTLWGEARGEPRLGKEAVAAVVLNRLRRNAPGRFGATVEEVCRKPQQFSCWNQNDPNRAQLERVDRSNVAFAECLAIAEQAVDGRLSDPTIGADHYHTKAVSPSWSRGKTPCRTIGRHHFFNNIP
jgi:N-acetylmuramoyl-L-alanine amidase